MKTAYTAYFYTDAQYATTEIAADTPGLALAAACRINHEGVDNLQFETYDEPHPVNHIEIFDKDHNELARWRDADLLLRMAGPDLLKALEFCDMTLADLEASKRKGYIAEAKKLARRAIERAKSPTSAVWPYL